MQTIVKNIENLFDKTFHHPVLSTELLPASGSNRKYFRITYPQGTAIGVFNDDKKENEAFLSFTKHFLHQGIAVPQILAEDIDNNIYLLSDLGDETLYSFLTKQRQANPTDIFPEELMVYYKKALKGLLNIQFCGKNGLDFGKCYPRGAFDAQSIRWDLNYFKYYFLKLAKIPFDEQLLENDFDTLTDFLLEADSQYFLYRDFQSRNLMILNGEIYFIDYQGGRKGALQYDVASLLYDGKANIPEHIREELLEYYIENLQTVNPQQAQSFRKYYYAFVFIRIMQAMGSYGFRGFYEGKKHFLQSIPFALNNLKWLLANVQLPIDIPHLWHIFAEITDAPSLQQFCMPKLQVQINSFSYKDPSSLPVDLSGNGGGFVFDCRCLPNPGRYEQYKRLNGTDQQVKDFLDNSPEVALYFDHVKSIADMAVKNYTSRSFTNLMISFGCTGGQHRSVYFANKLSKYLQSTYDIDIETSHLMQEKWVK
ncbi:MAG: phosphotransferase [Bacteroidales bacterium]|nr:phosphotransferase [Bacteroidales bacterium]